MTPTDDNLDKTRTHSRTACLVATAALLVFVYVPGIYHLAFGVRGSDFRRWGEWVRIKPAAQAIREIDADFDRRFLFRFMAVALTADVPRLFPRYDVATVRSGTGGFRFGADDIEVCTSAGFLHPRFPRAASAAQQLIDLDRQLKGRGIHLLVVPAPAKSSIYPDRLDPRYDPASGPLLNVDHAKWFARLREAGVDTVDLTDLLWAHRTDPEGLLYYPADTHWTDRAKRLAAGPIAERLVPWLTGLPRRRYATRVVTVAAQSDMEDPAGPRREAPEREEVVQLYGDGGNIVPGDEAAVLLIGDSYAAMGYDAGYGLAQRVMEAAGVPVQSAAMSGANGNSARKVLEDHPGLLRGKRVVIFAFALRQVMLRDWEPVTLGTRAP